MASRPQRTFEFARSQPEDDNDYTPSQSSALRGGGGPRGRRPPRGGRGRGGSGYPRPPPSSSPTPVSPAPRVVAPIEVPKPKALSTTTSVLKNDPMLDDAFAGPDGPSLTPDRLAPYFQPSLSGMDDIVSEIFTTIQVTDKNFRRAISPAMFSYYCQQHLMARVIAIRSDTGEASHSEDSFLDAMKHGLYPVPGILDSYLRSIGKFIMLNGTKYDVRLPDYSYRSTSAPKEEVGWGKVTERSQVWWMNYPHPWTYSYRIQQDMMITQRPATDPNWNLPVSIRPDPIGTDDAQIDPGLPTVNLCGWYPSMTLLTEQISVLQSAGISTTSFPSDGFSTRFLHNRELMEQVALRLKANEAKYAIAPGPHLSVFGSIGQGPKVKVSSSEIEFKRLTPYTKLSPVYITSVEALDPRITWGASMFQYRLEREEIDDTNPWSCYDWDEYTDVPATWCAHRNDLLEAGSVALLNVEHLRSSTVDRYSLIQRACAKSQKTKGYD